MVRLRLENKGEIVGYIEFKDGAMVFSNGKYVSPYCISIWKGKVFAFSPPAYGGSYYDHEECEFDAITVL